MLWKPKLAITLIVLAMTLSALPRKVIAGTALDDGLDRLAQRVAEFIEKEKGEKAVLVGDFIAPPRLKSGGGAGLSHALTVALKRQEIDVRANAPFQLVGQFTVKDEKAHDQDDYESLALSVTATVLDRDDLELVKLKISIFSDAPLQIAGGTVDLPPRGTEKDRQVKAKESFQTPLVAIVGDETRSSKDSPFGIEVRIRQGRSEQSKPRTPKPVDDRSFVPLSKGEEYIIRLHNRASFEAAATLSIDGLSMFAFSEEPIRGESVLIPPKSFVDIPGWHVTNQHSDAFEVTSYAMSAAASKSLSPSSTGVITGSFAAAWAPDTTIPSDELPPENIKSATGRGAVVQQVYKVVPRVIGRTRTVLSVRYDR